MIRSSEISAVAERDLGVPFGGAKQNGIGPERFRGEALRFFTEPKNVCIAK
jgi:acyl-CoA reductase-like NAD-dependent aldehyde dehydrogenase